MNRLFGSQLEECVTQFLSSKREVLHTHRHHTHTTSHSTHHTHRDTTHMPHHTHITHMPHHTHTHHIPYTHRHHAHTTPHTHTQHIPHTHTDTTHMLHHTENTATQTNKKEGGRDERKRKERAIDQLPTPHPILDPFSAPYLLSIQVKRSIRSCTVVLCLLHAPQSTMC